MLRKFWNWFWAEDISLRHWEDATIAYWARKAEVRRRLDTELLRIIIEGWKPGDEQRLQ